MHFFSVLVIDHEDEESMMETQDSRRVLHLKVSSVLLPNVEIWAQDSLNFR